MTSKGWTEKLFSEVVDINPSVPLKRGNTYSFVDMQSIEPFHRYVESSMEREFAGGGSKFQNRDILMARITPCLENGKIAQFKTRAPEAAAHGSTEFIVLRGKPGVTNTNFVYYLTTSDLVRPYAIAHMTGSSGRQRVPTDCFKHLTIPVPSLKDQLRIVSVIGTLDDKIEVNREQNTLLDQIAQTIFREWFLQAKNAQTLTLEEIVDINPSYSLPRGAPATYVDMGAVPTEGQRPSNWYLREFSSGTKFRNGDTLLARITPCLENGKTAFIDFLNDGETAWGSTEFIVLRPRPPLPPYFAYLLARRPDFRNFAIQTMTGSSGRQRVQVDRLAQFKLHIPDEAAINTFTELIEPIAQRISVNDDEARALANLRETLLPRLVRGEIDLKAIELEVDDA